MNNHLTNKRSTALREFGTLLAELRERRRNLRAWLDSWDPDLDYPARGAKVHVCRAGSRAGMRPRIVSK